MPTQRDNQAAAAGIDPALAFVEFAEEYRRSWRCWLIGGPAAVDDLSIGAVGCTTGLPLPTQAEGTATAGSAATAGVRLGRMAAILRAGGTRDRMWRRLSDSHCTLGTSLVHWLFMASPCALFWAKAALDPDLAALWAAAGSLQAAALVAKTRIHHPTGEQVRHLGRSIRDALSLRRPEPPATVVIAGPDPESSAHLYALFIHLAGLAALDDPSQGGTVLDAEHSGAAEALLSASDTRWSSVCRMQLGDAVPGPRRVRLVHMVLPADGRPDAQCRHVLSHAAQVWLALPDAGRASWAEEIAAAAPEAGVTRVIDAEPTSPGSAGTIALNLQALCRRYLRGEVPAGEAAQLVRRLVGGDEAPEAAAGAEEPARQPGAEGRERVRTR